MTLNPEFPTRFQWHGLFARRATPSVEPKAVAATDEARAEECARRDFMNRVMCENAGAIEGEHGMQAMMSMYPQHF